jgi:alpha-amylase/alpha-mannosidase (GH57 family)
MSDSPKIYVAFLWHQHQPYYTNDLTGETILPWVRLHGMKDYIGMARIVERNPQTKLTVNFVPSLLKQLLDMTERGHEDVFMQLARKPAKDLTPDEREVILRNFFHANLRHMIEPYPRYYELLIRRDFENQKTSNLLRRYSDQDFLDLQVLANLVWFHGTVVDEEPQLRYLVQKGEDYTEEEKQFVLNKEIDILREIIPLHRRLMEKGQIELTTTPYYHPILPLLVNIECAKRCMPGVTLPEYRVDNRDDAVIHVRRAIEYHEKLFGCKPMGMWPAEGSVSEEILPILMDNGIRWIATDEEILAHSIQKFVSRDSHGNVQEPDVLYKPYLLERDGKSMSIIFRDHNLSDLIGFQYGRNTTDAAVADFLSRLQQIANQQRGTPWLVSVILDGENAWEYYANQGIDFLSRLYERISHMRDVQMTTVSDYLMKHSPSSRISSLFPGSWINHDFYIWIGDTEDVKGWECLNRTKDYLLSKKSSGKYDSETMARAEEEVLIAEGSDWYWWFGSDHSSANDKEFDILFRTHLKNVYKLLGDAPPNFLDAPIKKSVARDIFTPPRALLDIKLDGRVSSFFEWLGAGHSSSEPEQSVMEKVTENLMTAVYFGFDQGQMFVRVDAIKDMGEILAEGHAIRIKFIYPRDADVTVLPERTPDGAFKVAARNFAPQSKPARACADRTVEIAVPFECLDLRADRAMNFFVELMKGEIVIERLPMGGPITITAPTEDFDIGVW